MAGRPRGPSPRQPLRATTNISYESVLAYLISIVAIMIAWILIEPDEPRDLLFIILLGVVCAEFFVGLGFFLVNFILIALVGLSGGEASKEEKKWIRYHITKHIIVTLIWAFVVVFLVTGTRDIRISLITCTLSVVLLFVFGNFYRDLDRLPSDLRKGTFNPI